MDTGGSGSFTFADYEEDAFGGVDGGPKVTRSTVTNTYAGTIQGTGRQAYLGLYRNDAQGGGGTGVWVGLEQITGRLGERQGSFAITQRGTFDDQGVQGTWEVVAGSGTGELTGLRGTGSFTYSMGASCADYRIEYGID